MKKSIITLSLLLTTLFAFSQKKQDKQTVPVDSSFTVKLTPEIIREISKIVVATQNTLTTSNTPMKDGLPIIQQLEYLNRFFLSLQPKTSAPETKK